MSLTLKNFALAWTQTAEEKAKGKERLLLEKIERLRERREAESAIAVRYAAMRDKVEAAKQSFAIKCAEADGLAQFPSIERYAADFLRGCPLAEITRDMASRSAFEANVAEFKAALYRLVVEPAEKSLADFTRANKSIISKLPTLQPAPEPVFVPAPKINEWNDTVGPSVMSEELRLMLGLRKGELMPPPSWEKPTGRAIAIRDLDGEDD